METEAIDGMVVSEVNIAGPCAVDRTGWLLRLGRSASTCVIVARQWSEVDMALLSQRLEQGTKHRKAPELKKGL